MDQKRVQNLFGFLNPWCLKNLLSFHVWGRVDPILCKANPEVTFMRKVVILIELKQNLNMI